MLLPTVLSLYWGLQSSLKLIKAHISFTNTFLFPLGITSLCNTGLSFTVIRVNLKKDIIFSLTFTDFTRIVISVSDCDTSTSCEHMIFIVTLYVVHSTVILKVINDNL